MASQGKKLLVADDSLTIQKVIRLALSNEGYDIQAVSDGNDAVQQISLFRPEVVLIDVSLPGKSAFEVKRAINEQGDANSVRFVLMSSAFEKVNEDEAANVEFHGRLTKPFDPAHLRQVLSEALAGAPAPSITSSAPPPIQSAHSTIPSRPDFASVPSTNSQREISLDSLAGGFSGGKRTKGESSDSLWADQVTEAPVPAAAPPHVPPPLSHTGMTGETDIRALTEATVRMSGLNNYEWSIQEPAGKSTPPKSVEISDGPTDRLDPMLRPPSNMTDISDSQFNPGAVQLGDSAESINYSPAHSLNLDMNSSVDAAPLSFANLGDADEDTYEEFDVSTERGVPLPPPPPGAGGMPQMGGGSIPGLGGAMSVPLSIGQVEEAVEKRLQETVERMVQRVLPEIAEKIIKAEIHKLLQQI